jgi:uncharacterized protein
MATEDKPSRNEDEYFVRLDAELMKERRAKLDAEREQQQRAASSPKCPKCGGNLNEREIGSVKIDECDSCGGIWLDKGELELIQDMDGKSTGFMSTLFRKGR